MRYSGFYEEIVKIWSSVNPSLSYMYGLSPTADIFSHNDVEKALYQADMIEKEVFSRHHTTKLNELKSIIQCIGIKAPYEIILEHICAVESKRGFSAGDLITHYEKIRRLLEAPSEGEYMKFKNAVFRSILYSNLKNMDEFDKISDILNIGNTDDHYKKIPSFQDDATLKEFIDHSKGYYLITSKKADPDSVVMAIKSIISEIGKSDPGSDIKKILSDRLLYVDYKEHFPKLKDGIINDINSHMGIEAVGDAIVSSGSIRNPYAINPPIVDIVDDPYAIIHAGENAFIGDILNKTVSYIILINILNSSSPPFPSFFASATALTIFMEENIFQYGNNGNESGINMKHEAHISYLKEKLKVFMSAYADIMMFLDNKKTDDIVNFLKSVGVPEDIIDDTIMYSVMNPMHSLAIVNSYERLSNARKIMELAGIPIEKTLKLFSEIHNLPDDFFDKRIERTIKEMKNE